MTASVCKAWVPDLRLAVESDSVGECACAYGVMVTVDGSVGCEFGIATVVSCEGTDTVIGEGTSRTMWS